MQVYKWHKFPLTSVPIKFEDIKKELTWLGLDQTSIAANDQLTIFIQFQQVATQLVFVLSLGLKRDMLGLRHLTRKYLMLIFLNPLTYIGKLKT